MIEIIRWLKEIEHKAGEMFLLAANYFSDDEKLHRFLIKNAEDEAWHYHVMGSAAEYFSTNPSYHIPGVSIDVETDSKINGYLTNIQKGLSEGTITRDQFIEDVTNLELSEWNSLFLYVINTLKEYSTEFKYPVARLQAHLTAIENFLKSSDGLSNHLDKIKEIPQVWVENILIVDDDEMLTELFKSLLNKLGNIDIANNGEEALTFVKNKYYKLILSDIDMPVLDGIMFYKKAIEEFPKLSSRFLFISGDLSKERKDFFKLNNIPFLKKPMGINELKDLSSKIILADDQEQKRLYSAG
jgi:CheY-like chemotaxis protein